MKNSTICGNMPEKQQELYMTNIINLYCLTANMEDLFDIAH